MAFEKVTGYRDHDEEFIRVEPHGSLMLSRGCVDRWFRGADKVELMVDRDKNRLAVMPETASGDEKDKRKMTFNDNDSAQVSWGRAATMLGINAQDVEHSREYEPEEHGQYGCPVVDLSDLVEEHDG